MQQTTNYKFKKPQDDDFFNVQDFADMMDGVDAQLKKQETDTGNAVANAKKAAEDVVANVNTELANVVNDAREAAQAVLASKANRYKKVSVTMLASAWTGTAAPYQIVLSISGITATNDIQVIPQFGWTLEQSLAWMAAAVISGSQAVGKLTLKAIGDKPTVDITIDVLIGDEVS